MASKGVEQQQRTPSDRDFVMEGEEGEAGAAPENKGDAIMHLGQDLTEKALPETEEGESDAQLALPHDADSKKGVPGIIYLGHIPPRFRPRHVRNLLSVYGEVGRIFLQPEGERVSVC